MPNNVYALLVGINEYKKVGKLAGCINDIEKVEAYLTGTIPSLNPPKLLNERATKDLIVHSFQEISKKIESQDAFLFYFCGHGTLEYADPLWNEISGRLECVVCYDQYPELPSSYLLADKELRYLINGLSKTGCHITLIFDCCHSGSNTRDLQTSGSKYPYQDVRVRRDPFIFPRRQWHDFLFGSQLDQNTLTAQAVNTFLPQGPHVQIAACESDETAVEVNGSGVFTQALLKILEETGGDISYYNLRSRIRQYLRYTCRQQPRIYSTGASDQETQHLLFSPFLNLWPSGQVHFVAEAVFNNRRGWILNLGVIHGITLNTTVDLSDPTTPGNYLNFHVDEVFVDHALLGCNKSANIPSSHTALKARVKGLKLDYLKLHLAESDADFQNRSQIADAITTQAVGQFILTDNEADADYTLHSTRKEIYITHPGEKFRPLTQPIAIHETAHSITQLIEFLSHIAKWKRIQQLQNRLVDNAEAKLVKSTLVHVNDGNDLAIPISKEANGEHEATVVLAGNEYMQIRLTNQSDERLFIGVAYLSFNFQVYINLLEGKVQLLNPGETASLRINSKTPFRKRELIPLELPEVVKEYNWPAYTETLKIIISSQEFSHEMLALDSLPSAYTLKDRDRSMRRFRSFDFEKDSPITLHGWTTQTLNLKFLNGCYGKVDPAIIEQMLSWEKTAFFAEGLYGR